jgi:hypothetical protein
MKKYGRCPKFGRGDNLTYTLKYVLYGEMGLKKERIWSNVKKTTSHLQNKLTKKLRTYI